MKSNKYTVLRNLTEDEISPLNIDDFIEDKSIEEIDIKNVVLIDSREKRGWDFSKSEIVSSVEKIGLHTGDYSIKGFEKDFVIERKGSTAEFAQNIFQDRFEKELKRLDEFKWPYLICEFDLQDLLDFPINSGIPSKLWNKVKASGKFLLSAFMRYQVIYKTKFILAGSNGMETAESLFKMINKYAK